MENASKALIIAGAILISIVLITLGVVILGQGQEVVNSSNMDAQAISSFNSQFTQYEGDSVTGSRVNTLINAVISSNTVSNRDGEVNKLINITVANGTDITLKTSTASDITYVSGVTTRAKSGTIYKVTVDYGTAGYINTITISKVK